MKLVTAILLGLLSLQLNAADTTEAAKAAAWVRAMAPLPPDKTHFGALGSLNTTYLGPALDTVRTKGPAAFYNDATALASAKQALTSRGASYLPPLIAADLPWFRDVQQFPWGMIEVSRGIFRHDVTDTIITAVQNAGGRYIGTVMPYAGWELIAAGYAPTGDAQCHRLLTEDVFYLTFDRRMDRFKDLAEYSVFLQDIVERYDGDGIDDMPGLTTPVTYWQIHNEPEGNHCGLFRDDVPAFFTLMKTSYELIHQSCATCKVLNGGAAFPLWRENDPIGGATFWRDFVALGGAQYIDVIAVHYNDGKSPGFGNIDNFEYQIRRAHELLGSTKPLWVTEYGVQIGTDGGFAGMTEAQAGAWFVRFDAAGLAAGAERFFPDAASFTTPDGKVYLPYYVNKLVEAELGDFTSAVKIASGQYRFTVNGADVYVLWNGVPPALTGTVTATDMYGNQTTLDAAALAPTEAAPLFVKAAATATRRRASRH
jgi:hypothetical protein